MKHAGLELGNDTWSGPSLGSGSTRSLGAETSKALPATAAATQEKQQ
jgi:hypothetical protein